MSSRRKSTLLLVAVGALLCVAAEAGSATTYNVTSLLDGVAVDGVCTLREAIRAADDNQAVNECPAGGGDDEVVLASSGSYSFSQGEEELADSGVLALRGLTNDAGAHQIDLGQANRLLSVTSGYRVTLENLTVKRGFANGAGGALRFAAGEFVLRNVTIRDSEATSNGGGLFASLAGEDDIVTHNVIERCWFIENGVGSATAGQAASGGGAAVHLGALATIEVRDSRFEGNSVRSSGLGAVSTGGGLALRLLGPTSGAFLSQLELVGNEVDGAGAWGAGAGLVAQNGAQLVVEDLFATGNGASHALPSERGLILDIELASEGAQSLRLRRFALLANGGTPSADAEMALRAEGSSDSILESGVVAANSHAGLRATAVSTATVRLGQLTIAGNDGAGLTLSSSSAFPPRLENSILWGNAAPGGIAEDLVSLGPSDTDRVTNHNWIGDQGDPDPLFVDFSGRDFSLQALSGAVDTGDSTFTSVGPFDVRHAPREVGGEIDLGAYERGGLFADDFEAGDSGAWDRTAP